MSRPLEAKFYNPERKRWNIYDFEIVGLDHTIAQDLKDGRPQVPSATVS